VIICFTIALAFKLIRWVSPASKKALVPHLEWGTLINKLTTRGFTPFIVMETVVPVMETVVDLVIWIDMALTPL
jgi:hypothetical protein